MCKSLYISYTSIKLLVCVCGGDDWSSTLLSCLLNRCILLIMYIKQYFLPETKWFFWRQVMHTYLWSFVFWDGEKLCFPRKRFGHDPNLQGVEKVKEELITMRFIKPWMVSGKDVESSFLYGLCRDAADAALPSEMHVFLDFSPQKYRRESQIETWVCIIAFLENVCL